ncbi:hypothetical protein EZV73_21145 [Acidaminobacter sp. JC074]|uniref:NAD(P)-binding domain-containing protein n=1 Tax=Acidaminobacter sp. JC074 TaxID=2530199 RepID=UPI001F101BC2|nr:NAD(P)-binding domain-containing protein [Acidaminobacter sp. JC074]MCH4890100.1 hypothetical protein [Acidaminobacter sp. JC074]
MKIYDVVIIGGGPSGISCSYHLKRKNIDHLIVEKYEMLHTWKNERWDSFYLVTPNWMTNLPGVDHLIPYDNEFMSRAEIEHVLMEYLYFVKPMTLENTSIQSVDKIKDYYQLNTNNGLIYARNIIVATGLFNQPFTPKISDLLPDTIHQIHSKDYKNPSQLVEGATLVVGSGRSGVQIALEVKETLGCKTYLSVGSSTPLPVVYKNINGVFWLNKLSGYHDEKKLLTYSHDDLNNKNIIDKLNQNLYHCQVEGVEIVGRMVNVIDGKIEFSDDLRKILDDGHLYLERLESMINDLVHKEDLPVQENVPFDLKDVNYDILKPLTVLDLEKEVIKNIIWCTGFKANYKWLTLDVFDDEGELILVDGISTSEHVYFCGMDLKPDPNTKSSFGVGLYALVESAKRAVDKVISDMESR